MERLKSTDLKELEQQNQDKDALIGQLKAEAEAANMNALTALDVAATLYEMLLDMGGATV